MYKFKLGRNIECRWWDLGVRTMMKGEKAQFKISSEYAYEAKGNSKKNIPAFANLIYEVELVDVKMKSKWDSSSMEK